jgi:hypothetical protein
MPLCRALLGGALKSATARFVVYIVRFELRYRYVFKCSKMMPFRGGMVLHGKSLYSIFMLFCRCLLRLVSIFQSDSLLTNSIDKP